MLSSLVGDAASPSWSVRAAAGRRLAAYAEDAEVAAVLHRLLLDGQDTFVTQETAEGLLERWDVVGLRLVLAADAVADDDAGDHLHAALLNVCRQSFEDEERLEALCTALASDTDPAVRAAARRIFEA
ncbi:hypothetical protein M5362_02575 [Streptomyces sp. Je 1-79]|uniref:hypothetical protein n=1 Tax=Streptomyces sp. Je 1-79 TaxID=2943847 RepID=UPI0021A33864|nr:hypothetical protein [Streptomyces sp. Je 1-79]MCT4352022.1 hypothetical protein [Streptomyces sp. Je 1-79]